MHTGAAGSGIGIGRPVPRVSISISASSTLRRAPHRTARTPRYDLG